MQMRPAQAACASVTYATLPAAPRRPAHPWAVTLAMSSARRLLRTVHREI